jgi:haloalkane dehalogenase
LAYHYLDEGEGDPLVMVHGNPTWSFYFRALVSALSPRYRTIVPDHIGCGLSAKPTPQQYGYRLINRIDDLDYLLQQITDQTGLTLIGHDWGGMIATGYALRRPERVKRLVLMNTAAFLPPGGRALPYRLRLLRQHPQLATYAVLGLNLFARGALYMAPASRLTPDVKAGLIAPYNNWSNRMATLQFVLDIPLTPEDPSYKWVLQADRQLSTLSSKPLLLCWGERDFVFTRHYLAEWQRRFPEAEVHRFKRGGHYLLEDEPARVAALIAQFLRRHPL